MGLETALSFPLWNLSPQLTPGSSPGLTRGPVLGERQFVVLSPPSGENMELVIPLVPRLLKQRPSLGVSGGPRLKWRH